MLELNNISKTINKKLLFQNMNILIPKKKILFILGANGTGKTTLLKMILNLSTTNSGTILLNQKRSTLYYKKKIYQDISYFPQKYSFYSDMLVKETIKLGFYNHKNFLPKLTKQEKDYLQKMMKEMDVLHLQNKFISTLSGGELQRVLLSRLFCTQTPYFLLDEPTSQLDIYHKLECLTLCRQFKNTYSSSFLITTHDIALAYHFADIVLLLGDLNANKYLIGTPQEILTKENLKKAFKVEFIKNETGLEVNYKNY